ncbi:hypothetical protein OAO87_00415 [bacterium]|nr:hypothetical protein [bacterium]
MPGVLTFDQAVTLPGAYTTAHCCFLQAQIRSLQDVLVHAASGGVGLVSVQFATRARMSVHATAGGVAKHAVLRSCNVVHSVSSSRKATACAAHLSCLLGGLRLHTVLNALSNDFVTLSLGLAAWQGTFCGKSLAYSTHILASAGLCAHNAGLCWPLLASALSNAGSTAVCWPLSRVCLRPLLASASLC